MKAMRDFLIIAIFFCFASACRQRVVAPSVQDEVVEVSLIQLIATPEKFNGKNVSTIGFYHGGNENSAIYFSREDALIRNRRNGISIGGSAPNVNGKSQYHIPQNTYISVSEVFQMGSGGHGGLWPGMIYPINSLSVYDLSSGEWRVLE